MYAVEVRDHIMIAHSLKGEVFGPAQALHGATFVIDVAFFRATLDAAQIVVDIGRATTALRDVCAALSYRNLDDHPAFAGVNTTTEHLAKWVFDRMAEAARDGRLGPGAAQVERIRVSLEESHVARAWYEAALA